MAGFGAVLVASSPRGPVQQVAGAAVWLVGLGGEQPGDLVAGERDLPWWLLAGVFGGGGDGEECQRGHGEGDPAVPGGPGADLVLIQPG